MSENVLIFEGDAARVAALVACAERAGFSSEVAGTDDKALERVRERLLEFSLMILGPGLSVAGVSALLEGLRQEPDAPPALALVEEEHPETTTELMRAGASEVLPMSAGDTAICAAIRRVDDVAHVQSDLSRIKGHSAAAIRLDDLRGAGDDMDRAVALGERAARMQMHVLLEGELGVGKRLMARAIHAGSDRAARPFIEVDCARIAGNDAEAVLFDRRQGLYWQARGGSLFLNEIEVLPPGAQVRIATLMEEPDRTAREIFHDNKPEVRLLASASRDMLALVKAGAFREDLFYRLNICPIWLPPLRRRREDIAGLARGLMRAFALETGRRIESLSQDAVDLLGRYDWPGNLFELEREMLRAVLLADERELAPRHFPRVQALAGLPEPQAARPRVAAKRMRTPERRAPARKGGGALVEGMPTTTLTGEGGGVSVGIPALTERGEVRSLEEVEADMIRLALGRYRGSMTEAARRLGIGRSTLYRKIREFGLDSRGGSR
ncbi:sigma-54-dependent transcriptional regulator [Dichotomicrobium thermohalophilum]|uniref:DNA-binding transcriptional regulator NtrC n=1 Tax=Dichotomicrobium thermohalophilum TaxID=933063 RepID=A0A397PGT0_9HYPH|nr:sigma 54-interacting transcriptional regulator [Dichotomicrobium thermohalophilum]RIA45354.1 DNA-binding NtrC family response regulator [Dichotomicrobium thermohalophilum]